MTRGKLIFFSRDAGAEIRVLFDEDALGRVVLYQSILCLALQLAKPALLDTGICK